MQKITYINSPVDFLNTVSKKIKQTDIVLDIWCWINPQNYIKPVLLNITICFLASGIVFFNTSIHSSFSKCSITSNDIIVSTQFLGIVFITSFHFCFKTTKNFHLFHIFCNKCSAYCS